MCSQEGYNMLLSETYMTLASIQQQHPAGSKSHQALGQAMDIVHRMVGLATIVGTGDKEVSHREMVKVYTMVSGMAEEFPA